jgi:hypothetical protein
MSSAKEDSGTRKERRRLMFAADEGGRFAG